MVSMPINVSQWHSQLSKRAATESKRIRTSQLKAPVCVLPVLPYPP